MSYEQRWLLAVAMKQPYPPVDTGAADEPKTETEKTQASLLKIAGAVVAVGVIGYFLMR